MWALRRLCAVGIVGAVLLGTSSATGQVQRTPATLDDILTEIRGLRSDMVAVATAGVRVQTLTGRLALQEQRIAELGRRYTEIQLRLDETRTQLRGRRQSLENWERDMARGTLSADVTRELQGMIARTKTDVGRLEAEEQKQAGNLIETANQVAAEQARWTEFSSRLDELERLLPTAR